MEAWTALVSAGAVGAAILLPTRVKFFAARVSLARAAQKHGVESGLRRAVTSMFAPWAVPCLLLRRDDRVVEADACSLGVLRDDPPWTWWWVRSSTKLPVFTLVYIRPRTWVEKHAFLDLGTSVASGDEAFDAQFSATMYRAPAECVDVAKAMLGSPEVRRVLRELVAGEDDSCSMGSHISVTRRRTGASFDDAFVQMERVATLASASEEVFTPSRPYR
jgi:hypothetical protein